jgi:exonuclease III
MAFRKKWDSVMRYNPDILIIQECEHESKYKPSELIPNCNQFLWHGENPNKGIGIFTFNDFQIQLSESYNNEYRYIIPLKVSGPIEINLFAIWAMPDKENTLKSYVGQIWQAINYYQKEVLADSILIGDWNSNVIWDKDRRIGNHSEIVDLLGNYGIVSLYHELRKEKQGQELEPTLYLLKKEEKPYHIDYCFLPEKLVGEETRIKIGKYQDWISLSDHMPIIIDNLAINNNGA